MIYNKDAERRLIRLNWKDTNIITLSEIIENSIKECKDWDSQNCEIHYKVGSNSFADLGYQVDYIKIRSDCQQIEIYIESTGLVHETGGSCILQDEDIV